MSECQVYSIAARGAHTIALTSGGVFSWGKGTSYQLGQGVSRASSNRPQKVKGLDGISITAVACGRMHSAAVTDDGNLYTWGSGEDGAVMPGFLLFYSNLFFYPS